MILRRLCSLVARGALVFSSGCCCWQRHCCEHPILFPRIREAYCNHCHGHGCSECGCSSCGCSTCCHSGEFAGSAMPTTAEPAIAPPSISPLPMPRAATMKPAN